jgi:hypothetical protein
LSDAPVSREREPNTFELHPIDRLASVVTDPGIGIQRSDSLALFCGERKSGSSRQGSESLLQGKKHQQSPEISPIWDLLAPIFSLQFLVFFCAFIRSA